MSVVLVKLISGILVQFIKRNEKPRHVQYFLTLLLAGWIFGVTSEPMDRHMTSESGVVHISQDSKQKIQKLRY